MSNPMFLGHDNATRQRMESDAARFARALLMPSECMREMCADGATVDDIAARFGVSREAALRRLECMQMEVE